jgi:hypothetical protein
LSILIAVVAGCNPQPEERRQENIWLRKSISDTAMNQAIIAQYTLFPYHFISNSPMLNGLGRHDLDVLASHFSRHLGDLNVRQGDVATALYEARVATVIDALADAGVERDRINIGDALPGGDGMTSERVLSILGVEPGGTAADPQTGVSG